MGKNWLFSGLAAALIALAAPWPALAQTAVDLDTRLKLPAAAQKDDASRLFWLKNAGKVARARDDFEGTRLAWEAALPLAERLHGPDSRETEKVLFELGLALYDEGQFTRALPIYQRDYQLRRALFGPDSVEALVTLSNIAGIFSQLGRDEDALPVQEQIYEAGLHARGESDEDVLIDRNNLALTYRKLGRIREAEGHFREIIRLRRARGDTGESMVLVVGNLAQLLNREGRSNEVAAVVGEAGMLETLRTPETGQFYVSERHFLADQLAASLFATGKVGEAIDLLRPTVARARERLGPAHPDTIGYERALAEYISWRSFDFRESDPARFAAETQDALVHARAATQGLEARTAALGFTPTDEAAAEGDSALRVNAYSLLAVLDGAALSVVNNPREQAALQDEALKAIQQAMSGTASRAVAETAARNAAAGKGLADVVEQRQELADAWVLNQQALASATARRDAAGEAERVRLAEEGKVLEGRLSVADARLRTDFPAYFDLIRPAPLGRLEAANLVRPDEAVLLILPTEQATQVMLITDQGIGWSGSSLTAWDVTRLTRRLLWDVGGNVDVTAAEEAQWSDEGEGAYPFDRTTAYKLYQELVEPNAELIKGKRHLFVIAGGALSSLPFGMLVTAPPQGADGDPEALRQTSWLADMTALIQLPSLQSLAYLRKYDAGSGAPDVKGREFLGFGDPVLEGAPEPRGGRGKNGARRRTGASVSRGIDGELTLATLRRMVRLPGTAVELEAMRKAMAAPMGQLFTGPRATEANFRRADLTDARVIALATHGLMAGELAGNAEPGLVFTPPATPSPDNDGFLSASEIAALRFSAEWVILSACNTAAGDGRKGAPGLSGLARAFFYAGAGSLLASHWPVRDDVASRLTVRSIEIRRDNPDLSRAEALQRAMREIRMNASHDTESDTWAHPSAWAPFTLVGDGTR